MLSNKTSNTFLLLYKTPPFPNSLSEIFYFLSTSSASFGWNMELIFIRKVMCNLFACVWSSLDESNDMFQLELRVGK